MRGQPATHATLPSTQLPIAMGLYQLICQSQSLVPFEKEEIVTLLAGCRAYNTTHNITGLLLYTPDGRFL